MVTPQEQRALVQAKTAGTARREFFEQPERFPGQFEQVRGLTTQRADLFAALRLRLGEVPAGGAVISPAPTPRLSDTPGIVDSLRLFFLKFGESAALGRASPPGQRITAEEVGFEPPSVGFTEGSLQQAQELRTIQQDIENVTGQADIINWKESLLISVPFFVETGRYTTVADILASNPPPTALSQADTLFVGRVLLDSQRALTDDLPTDITPEQRRRVVRSMTSRGSISTYGIMVSGGDILQFARQAAIGAPPPGMTDEDVRAMAAAASMTDAEIDLQLDADLRAWEDSQAEIKALTDVRKSAFNAMSIEELAQVIQDQKTWELWVERPALLLLLPFSWLRENTAQPLAGISRWVAGHVPQSIKIGSVSLPIRPGLGIGGAALDLFGQTEEEYQDFERLYAEARASNLNWWKAMGYSFENWDTNGLRKFIAEVLVDPISYFGFGWYARGLRALPWIGSTRGVKALAGAELGFIKATDQFFLKTFQGIGKVSGTTANIIIGKTTRSALHTIRAAIIRSVPLGVSKWKSILPQQLRTILRTITADFLDNPNDARIAVEAGAHLAAQPPTTRQAVHSMARRMGNDTFTDAVIDQGDLLAHVDTLLNVPGWTDTEIADTLLDMLGPSALAMNRDAARIVADDIVRELNEAILKNLEFMLAPDDVTQIMNRVGQHILNVTKATVESETRLSRTTLTSLTAWLTFGSTAMEKLLIAGAIERISYATARMYLLFPFYSVMNIVEVFIKSAFAKVHPFHKGDSRAMLANQVGHLQRVDDWIFQETAYGVELGHMRDIFRSVPIRAEGLSQRSFRRVQRLERGTWAERVRAAPKKLFIETGGRIGGYMQANYHLQVYTRFLREAQPEIFEAVERITADASVRGHLAGFSDEMVDAATREAQARAITDFRTLSSMSQDFTPDTVVAKDLVNMLKRYDEVGSWVQQAFVREAEANTLLPQLNRFFVSAQDMIEREVLARPELVREQLDLMVTEMITVPPQTVDEFRDRVFKMMEISDLITDVVDTHIVQVRQYASRFRSPQAKDEVYVNMWDNTITPFMEEAQVRVTSLQSSLDSVLAQRADDFGFDAVQTQRFRELMEAQVEHQNVFARARAEQRRVEDLLKLRRPPRGSSHETIDAWWDEWNAAREKVWDDAREGINESLATTLGLSDTLGVREGGQIADLTGVGRPTIENLAQLYGTIVQDLQRGLYMPEMGMMRSEMSWVSKVWAKIERMSEGKGATPDRLGWRRADVSQLYQDMIARMTGSGPAQSLIDPKLMALRSLRHEVEIYSSKKGAVYPSEIGASGKTVGEESIDNFTNDIISRMRDDPTLSPLIGDEEGAPIRWIDEQQSAWDKTLDQANLDFPNYNNDTAFNKVMKVLFPFWTYEAHRPFWIARNMVQRPGGVSAWAKYQDYSDNGYLRVPGTSMQFNPLRGTIWMGGFRSLILQDFPEYYDQYPNLSNTFDQMQRYGFFPNIFIGGFFAVAGAKTNRSQVGELLPPLAQWPLEAFINRFPQSAAAITLREVILPNRFRDYMTSQFVSQTGAAGSDLLNKRLLNIPLSEDEQAIWNSGEASTAGFNMLNLSLGLLRVRPQERETAIQAAKQVIAECTGVPIDVQDEMARVGMRVSDAIRIDPTCRELVDDLEEFKNWRGLANPLRESELGQLMGMITLFYDDVEAIRQQSQSRKNELNRLWRLPEGHAEHINRSTWETLMRQEDTKVHSFIEALSQSTLFRYNEKEATGVPQTWEQRVQFAEAHGIDPVIRHPTDEVLERYFDFEIGLVPDEVGGQRLNFRELFQHQRTFENVLSEPYRTEVLERAHKNDTDLEKIQRSDYDYMQVYFDAQNLVREQFSEEEQLVISEFFTTDSPIRQEELREVLDSEGNPLIARYQRELSGIRRTMRLRDPELDARLVQWEGLTPLTEAAVIILDRLRLRYGFASA